MNKLVFLLLSLTALIMQTMAEHGRVCTMQNANVKNGRIKTYSGKVVKEFNENDTPAMQGNDCVKMWCRAQCEQDRKCKKFAYLAIRGGDTTCTLYSSAKSKNERCPGNVCDSEFGKCTGWFDE